MRAAEAGADALRPGSGAERRGAEVRLASRRAAGGRGRTVGRMAGGAAPSRRAGQTGRKAARG